MLIVIPSPEGTSCGLSDHARVIAAELSQRGMAVSLCPWPQPWSPAAGTAILLQFTPLAYSRVGLPWGVLRRVLWSRLRGNAVVTYFHELPFTNGNTWKRQCAVMLQRAFCMLLAGFSDQAVLNQDVGLRWLGRLRPGSPPIFLPSCSNVGESLHVPPPRARPDQVVIFGSPGKRRHAHQLIAELGGYRRLFGATVTVLDIGEPLTLPVSLHEEVDSLGSLPPDEVFAYLLQCRYGFFYSEPHQFSKSGVFAAYCAAGVVPIIAYHASGESPFFLTSQQLIRRSASSEAVDRIWRNCRSWFARYSAKACADELWKLVSKG